jgi:RNA polymerase sigma factor (sigma-70 family)
MPNHGHRDGTGAQAGRFATTHWSVVLAAGHSSSLQHQPALSQLCHTYWYPLYAYLRRHGCDAHQAADHTQAFFTRLLEKETLKRVKPEGGKFRSFMLTALKHFISNERVRAAAQKRGGGRAILSLNLEDAENQYVLEPADDLTPDKLFEKSWALTLLKRAMDRLEAEMAAKGKQALFGQLKGYLAAETETIPYQKVAATLNMTEGTVRVSVHRLRRRCRALLRDEIAQTVTSSEEVDDEIHDLFTALG